MSLTSQTQRLKERKANALIQGGLKIQATALTLVARKTGFLENSLGITPPVTQGSVTSLDVGVVRYPVPYAGFVEHGAGGPKKYHRDGQVVHEGVGQHFLDRAVEMNRSELLNIIRVA